MVEITRESALALLREPEYESSYGGEQGALGASFMGYFCKHCGSAQMRGHADGCIRAQLQDDHDLMKVIEAERNAEERARLEAVVDAARARLKDAEDELRHFDASVRE